MRINNLHILTTFILALLMVVALGSCKDDSDLKPQEVQHAIAFASAMADEEIVSRSATKPMTKDFIVYGYKNVGVTEQAVFDRYTVKYKEGSANTSEDNTHGYYYVGGGQTIKYWDYSVPEYHFFGYYALPDNLVTYDNTDPSYNKLTLDVHMRVGDSPVPEDDLLYSELAVRSPINNDAIRLIFNHPRAKVCIQFYTNEPINDPLDNVDITNISFGPINPLVNKVYARGDMVVSYPKSTDDCSGNAKESFILDNLSEPQDALIFDDVTLTPTLGVSSNTAVTAPIDDSEGFRLDNMPGSPLKSPKKKASRSTTSLRTRAGEQSGRNYYYYTLPMGTMNPAFVMTACVDAALDPTPRTAVVPANFMQWKPNFFYTYIFKITGGGNIEFYDVQIEPWHYGGSQEEEWKNW